MKLNNLLYKAHSEKQNYGLIYLLKNSVEFFLYIP